MNPIAIYALTSMLHDPQSVASLTEEFLSALSIQYDWKGEDFSDFGTHPMDLIYVRTGGTEGIFQRLLPRLVAKSDRPFYFLASDKSNSLAASMEILSYLHQQGVQGEILHGNAEYVSGRITLLSQMEMARKRLQHSRLGIVGEPSDWLISSHVDVSAVRDKLGVELVSIPMEELFEMLEQTPEQRVGEKADEEAIQKALPMANRIYAALKSIIQKYDLQGFTIRCFDLLDTIHNTGCLALAKLNAEGFVAGCEGDVPAMLSMYVSRVLFGTSGFQSNPASVNSQEGSMWLAHCTIPLDMVQGYELDTHFESGIGVAVRGRVQEGPVTIFKMSGNACEYFAAEGDLVANGNDAELCRTQLKIKLFHKDDANYFLTHPIGNHHILIPGHHKAELMEFMNSLLRG